MEQQNSPAVQRQRIGQEKSVFHGSRARRHASLSLAAQLIKVSLVTAPFLLALLLFIFYSPEIQAQTPSSGCDNFTSGYDGWVIDSAVGATLSNPPGIMRLSSSGASSAITVTKTLTGYPGSINITSVFTSFSRTTLYFWVKYADNSTYYMFAQGNTSTVTETHYVNYTIPADKVPVALYFYAAVSSELSGFQIDIDYVCLPSLPPDQTLASECPLCSSTEKNHEAGRSINTYSGNYHDQTTDLSIANVGQPLRFERSYNSLPVTGTAVYSRPLGYGWIHNYDLNLTLPDDPGGEPGVVILKAPHGSRLRFRENGDGTYSPAPGVWANLVRQGSAAPYTYLITAANQTAYTFGLLTNSVVISPVAVTPPAGLTLTPHYNVAAAPGTVLTLTHTLTNTGLTTDTYTMTVASAGNWLAAQPVTATLAGGAAITVTARVTAPQTYGRDAVITASLAATSWTTPTLTATVVETLTLRGYRLLASADPQGNQTQFDYDSSGYLSRVSDPTGQRYLNFSYDGQSRLMAVTDHTNRSVGYGYDANNNLTVVTDTRSLTWTYAYTTAGASAGVPHYLHTITDPDQHMVTKTFFDGQGRAVRQEDGLTRPIAEITYLSTSTRVVTEAGQVMTDTYNSLGLLGGQADALGLQTHQFDPFFNRNVITDANNNVTRYERTSMGLTLVMTDALTNVTRFQYDARNNLTQTIDARTNPITYTYDLTNNLRSMTNLSGTIVYTYNHRGQVTEMRNENDQPTFYAYNNFGDRTVITNALVQTTTYGYDSLGRVVTTTDALGKVTVNTYDAAGNLVKVTENYLAGQPQNYQAEYNLITQYAYDGAGRQTVMTDTLARVTVNVYDNAGRLFQTIENKHPTITTQNYLNEYNLITAYGYDPFGRQTAITDTLGHVTRTVYDNAGRVKQSIVNYVDGSYSSSQPDEDIVTEYNYDANGNLIETIDTLGRKTCTEYDALNRVKRTLMNCQSDRIYNPNEPDQDIITAYGYDAAGNQTVMTDTLERPTTYFYDALNRVITITNPLGDLTSYGYDLTSNRIRVTDAEFRDTTYHYDKLNRVITITNALGGETIIVYDEVGNRHQVIDPRDNAITYTYDSLYRLETTTDAENQVTAYTYDALSNRRTQTDPEGRVTQYEYDSLNRLITTTLNFINGGPVDAETNVQTVAAYDPLGRRTRLLDPRSNATTYGYDDLGRTVAITDALLHVTHYTYDGLGNRRSVTNAENETTEFEYDEVNRLVLVRDPLGHETTYGYDGVGNRVQLTDAEEVITRYGYDDLDRLTLVTENYDNGGPVDAETNVTTRYGYDRVGNRTVITHANTFTTTYMYDPLNRQTDMIDALDHRTEYGYDAAGNRTVITTAEGIRTDFTYDKVNRLTGITYADTTPDMTFTYDKVGNRTMMIDATGTTTYTYDALYRLAEVKDGQDNFVGYGYDAAGNRTELIYPDNKTVSYDYDEANRLITVEDWNNGQFGYNYDDANRLLDLALPNSVTSTYTYDAAGRLTFLEHITATGSLAGYEYALDQAGSRTTLTETLITVRELPEGTYLESGGQIVMEAEHFGRAVTTTTQSWLTATSQSGYTGTAYLHALPDLDVLYQPNDLTGSPRLDYPLDLTTPGTYTVWLRGYASNAAGDSVYVGLNGQVVSLTGLAPNTWGWARTTTNGVTATLPITTTGLQTISVWMREDGLRLDRLLLTTDTTYIPTGFGPTETPRLLANRLVVPLERTIVYTYDNLYRLTRADYSTGELYEYDYDPVGNRLEQIINGDTTTYTYDDANRLATVDGQSYTFDDNGNLLYTGVLTNAFDAANRLTSTVRAEISPILPQYNGTGDRVAQTVAETTVYYALDVVGLPEVIQTSEGNSYLHLPGVIMAESAEGEVRYLLSDGLGSIRQAVDETGAVVSYDEFDPYGNPLTFHASRVTPYAYTGEWWQEEVGLLHLRARWYLAEDGVFVSRDPWLGNVSRPNTLHGYSYAANNPILYKDPSGLDYIPWLDRYTCDDPLAQSGYVYQYDQATGQWGLWPCIVDPNNVQTGNAPSWPMSPSPSPVSSPLLFSPPLPSSSACEICDPNDEPATWWLINTMVNNSVSPVANQIRDYNHIGVGPINQIPILPIQMLGRYEAYKAWIDMVKTGAPWDFKLPIRNREPGFEWGGQWVKICCNWYSYETFANVHYGYVGKAVNFLDVELLGGAGYAQWQDHHGRPGYEERIAKGEVGLHTYYDEPEDGVGVQIGINVYNNLATTPKKFCTIFNKFASRLKMRPADYHPSLPIWGP